MVLLSVEAVNTSSHGTILDVWEIGGKHRRIQPPFPPYCYSLKPEANGQPVKKRLLSDLQEHTVWKMVFQNIDMLERNRNRWTVEDTFPFKQRVAVDVGYKFASQPPKLLAWDIETKALGLSPNWREDKITSIAVWGAEETSHKCFIGADRKQIIQEFLAYLKSYDPDVLVDFYGRFYDVPCLIQNCMELAIHCSMGRDGGQPYIYKKEYERKGKGRIENTVRIRGRVHFDCHKEIENDYTLTLAGIKDRTLKTVARHYGLNPIQVDYTKMHLLSQDELREYNLSDARCTYELAQIYFRGLYALAEYLNMPIDMIAQRQPSHVGNVVIGREFQKLNIISDGENNRRFPQVFAPNRRSNEGATVRCFRTGIFMPIVHKDFHSMYPNIMRAFNLSPETVKLVRMSKYTGKNDFKINGNVALIEVSDKYNGQVLVEVDMSHDGVLRQVITDIINQRAILKKKWKETGDLQFRSREDALKVVANALYGYNAMGFSRYGNILVGILTTAIGRLLIQEAVRQEEKAGNTLLELDTDGLYILEKTPHKFDASTLFPQGFKTEYITQGSDKYDGIILIDEKSYVLYKNGKLIKHGSGILGRHIQPVVDDFVEELCQGLFKKEDPFAVMRRWDKPRLKTYPNSAFVSFVNLSKRPDSYHEGNLYSQLIKLLQRSNIAVSWGDRINFVKTTRGYTPTVLLKDGDRMDFHYYQSRMSEIASRILKKPFGEIREFFDGLTRLEEFA